MPVWSIWFPKGITLSKSTHRKCCNWCLLWDMELSRTQTPWGNSWTFCSDISSTRLVYRGLLERYAYSHRHVCEHNRNVIWTKSYYKSNLRVSQQRAYRKCFGLVPILDTSGSPRVLDGPEHLQHPPPLVPIPVA